ncbi:MAG: hypothetical protein ACFE78_06930 [Candidatus Hodarchaeota archaeon]
MTNVGIILQIMFISLGMVALSSILNKFLGINLQTARELRDKALKIQERMRIAQATGNVQEMYTMQRESTVLMKQMMKKQLIPSCIRCVVFLGIFALIGIFYVNYATDVLPFGIPLLGDGWLAVYFLFSIGFSLLIWGLKKLYRKLTGKIDPRSKISKEILEVLSPTSQETTSGFQIPTSASSGSKETEKLDSWKDRIKKN